MQKSTKKSSSANLSSKTQKQLLELAPGGKNSYPLPNKLPSGTLAVLKKGVDLQLRPTSPQRYNAKFEFQEVASGMQSRSPRKPFKRLTFDESSSTHNRTPTVIINECSQSYTFVSAVSSLKEGCRDSLDFEFDNEYEFLDVSDDILSSFSLTEDDEEPKEKERSVPANSIFASTAEPKSIQNSELRQTPQVKEERYSTIYTLSSDSSAKNMYTNSSRPSPQAFKNFVSTRFTTNTQESEDFKIQKRKSEELPDLSFGVLPTRTFCESCKKQVGTRVKIETPKTPFWKKICCSGYYNAIGPNEEITHLCRECGKLVAKVKATQC